MFKTITSKQTALLNDEPPSPKCGQHDSVVDFKRPRLPRIANHGNSAFDYAGKLTLATSARYGFWDL